MYIFLVTKIDLCNCKVQVTQDFVGKARQTRSGIIIATHPMHVMEWNDDSKRFQVWYFWNQC